MDMQAPGRGSSAGTDRRWPDFPARSRGSAVRYPVAGGGAGRPAQESWEEKGGVPLLIIYFIISSPTAGSTLSKLFVQRSLQNISNYGSLGEILISET